MKLRWSRDLYEIADFIAADDPVAAERWVARLRDRARRAARTPKAGRRVPERDRDDVREVLLGNYRIIYRVVRDGILVVTVTEGHRLLPAR